jgi:hypothetical protein
VDGIATVISLESKFRTPGGKLSLLKWTENTAKVLGTTLATLQRMHRLEQLVYVEKFFRWTIKGQPPRNIANYALIAWGRQDLENAADSVVVASAADVRTAGVYIANKEYDPKVTGQITVGDIRKAFWDVYNQANDKRTTEKEQGMVRMRPLPPFTVMWVDVIGDAKAEFEEWVRIHSAVLKVYKTVSFDTEILTEDTFMEAVKFTVVPDWLRDVKRVKRIWVLFEVTNAGLWQVPLSAAGIPTLAPKGEKTTPDDTVQRPPPLDPMDLIRDALAEIAKGAAEIGKPVAKGFGMVVGAALGVWGIAKLIEARSKKRG